MQTSTATIVLTLSRIGLLPNYGQGLNLRAATENPLLTDLGRLATLRLLRI